MDGGGGGVDTHTDVIELETGVVWNRESGAISRVRVMFCAVVGRAWGSRGGGGGEEEEEKYTVRRTKVRPSNVSRPSISTSTAPHHRNGTGRYTRMSF